MAGKGHRRRRPARAQGSGAHILIIEARYYEDIADEMVAGAIAVLEAARLPPTSASRCRARSRFRRCSSQAVEAGRSADDAESPFDGAMALGCVIRGETSHYDIVCNNANHWLMESPIRDGIPVGNAILTVDTESRRMERAQGRPRRQGRRRGARVPAPDRDAARLRGSRE